MTIMAASLLSWVIWARHKKAKKDKDMAWGLEIYDDKQQSITSTSATFVLDYFTPTVGKGSKTYSVPANASLAAQVVANSGTSVCTVKASGNTVSWDNSFYNGSVGSLRILVSIGGK